MAAWIAIQGFQNVGMNLELLPVTGVPLPFVSYGGSSMMALWLGIGIILNLDSTKRSY
jgi:rod shape determining protein RodA